MSTGIFWYRNFRKPYVPTEIRSCQKTNILAKIFICPNETRLGLFVQDLFFRFCVSAGNVSQIIITWVTLLSEKLELLIIWSSQARIRSTLPSGFYDYIQK